MENENVLISELRATINRVIIIKNNITDPTTKQLAEQSESILLQLILQIAGALNKPTTNDKKSNR